MKTPRYFKTMRFVFLDVWRSRVAPLAILLVGASLLYGTVGCGGGSKPNPSPSPSPTTSPNPSPTVSPNPSPSISPTASPSPLPTASPNPSPTALPSPTGVVRVHLGNIPLQTRSVRLMLARTTDGRQVSSLLAINGADTSARDIDVPDLEVNDYDVFVFAYTMDNGTGTTQASVQSAISVRRDQVAEVAVRLVITDTDITTVSTPGYSGDVGSTFTLTATSSTNPLLDAQTTWENRTPSVVQLSSGLGTQVTATALASGTAIIVVHDAVSGKTAAPLTLTVNAPAPPPTGNGTVNIR